LHTDYYAFNFLMVINFLLLIVRNSEFGMSEPKNVQFLPCNYIQKCSQRNKKLLLISRYTQKKPTKNQMSLNCKIKPKIF
jgi:hypothetical protein